MSHLIVSNLTKTVGDKTLFKDIEFTIYEGERVGLIGINGTGKSTLLSILAGTQDADSITLDHPNKYRIAYLPQEPQFQEGETVLQAVFSGDSPILQLNRKYEDTVTKLAQNPQSEALQNELFRLQQQMDNEKAWDVNALAKQALTKLGIDMYDQIVTNLSGGQQKRVALAKVLIEPADLYLLDEPTNHLDVQSTEWLQEMVLRLKGAVIFITHDRYFLDELSTHIYELADQTLYRHTGNYADYLESRAIREEMHAATQAKLRNRYRSELKWIRRGAKARTTKQKARIDRFEDLDSKIERGSNDANLEMNLATTRLGKKVIEGEHLTKAFGERTIVSDFNFLLQQGDRIGIIGANGYGKSTLLNMLAGELEPDAGEVIVGSTVKRAHFKQVLPPMNENERMIEYIREASNDITDAEGVRYSAAQMLERFLFPLHTHGTPIGKLSGGERKRLHLLRLLMEQPNVLLLDEPTNDLDIETLGVLEDFIEHFPGVVITISHDRFFLDRIAKKLWILDGKGNVEESLDIYSDYLVKQSALQKEEAKEVKVEKPKPQKPKTEKKKLSFKEQKEWETISDTIAQVEEDITTTEEEIATAGSDYTKLQALTEKLDQLNQEYERLIERWSYLDEIVNG
ncbi:ABC-F family ATP-binding cassette domain-containing protein [Lysinibacillus endophyticus]|uniref:ABC transporter ATP-binding protein n=1 Tax=Ureibacillus endophyticus TaxID=1978490 RepID=A0A494Z1W3_9BACL|nr:ABC-F family ATP-binding cassette domain-containing protein [Lysinibacillus endophyticus]MCP1144408.1 ABC-F family ATP-binding cassette domain-containing protein [Lysinibacillus endophyticus]RKQ15992.1 ABC transporter ATP-binding protein [Lysinibacillus endophyticus]